MNNEQKIRSKSEKNLINTITDWMPDAMIEIENVIF